MSSEFVQAIEALGKEKGINSEVLFQAVEEAVVSAYKKNYDSSQNVRVEMSKDTGEFHVFEQRKVVEEELKAATDSEDQLILLKRKKDLDEIRKQLNQQLGIVIAK